MDYQEANKLANEQHPVRRPSWPEHHHLRHHVEESMAKLKMHRPEEDTAQEWLPDAEDEAAKDWEQYIPRQRENSGQDQADQLDGGGDSQLGVEQQRAQAQAKAEGRPESLEEAKNVPQSDPGAEGQQAREQAEEQDRDKEDAKTKSKKK